MRRLSIFLAVLVIARMLSQSSAAQELSSGKAGVPRLEWNVFLGDWQLLGPFPKADGDPGGLETQFVKDESNLRVGRVTFYDRKLYTWRAFGGRTIDFREALGVTGSAGHEKVAYALTRFSSPVAMKARLSVGYDDHFVAWLNGQEVARGNDEMWGSLDQSVTDVDLQAGTNTLQLKVANGTKGWEGFVRLLPAEPVMPLIEFRTRALNAGMQLPTIEVELLDAQKQTIARHRCSGSRGPDTFSSTKYALYAPSPQIDPAFAKFSVREPGFADDAGVFPWKRALTGRLTVPLKADVPLQLTVVDAQTRQPIEGASVWDAVTRQEPATDGEGRVALPDFSPLSSRCYVAAAGFEAKTVNLKFPRAGVQRVELTPGGRSVVGTVVSTGGQPIAGATIKSGVSGGYSPSAVTDDAGQFELVSIPTSRTRLYPVIEAPGFVARGRFALELKEAETSVRWDLAPGATIAGRIVDKDSGEPVSGVTITTGDDRFGSNNPKATAISKGNGTYELIGVPAGETLIHAFSDDHAPAMQSITAALGTPVKLDWSLSEGRPVSGTIRDSEGNPVPEVRLITDTWNGARMFEREARTDSDGRFVLAHMPDSQAEVHVLKRGFISKRDLMVIGGDTVELTMLPTIVHTISIRDAAKQQIIPDLQISKGYLWQGNQDWYWQNSEYETSRFYNKLKGEMRIEIDEEPSTYEIAYRFRSAGFGEEIVKLPRELTEGKSFDVRMRPAEVFEGRVVDASSGQPLKDVIVAAVSRSDQLRADRYSNFMTPWQFMQQSRSAAVKSVTDEEGLFRLPAQSRSAEGAGLALMAKDGGFHFVDGDVFALAGDESDAVLELPMPASASLSGRLTIGGEPVARETVRIQWQGHRGGAQNDWNRAFGVGGQVTTDSDGRFSFARLGPGVYQLNRVFRIPLAEGSSMTAYLDSESVTLLPGADVVHDFVRPAGVKLSGVARTTDGKTIANCVVYATLAKQPNVRVDAAIAGSNGRFVFEHLKPGDYQLSAELQVRHPEGYYNTGFTGTTSVSVEAARDDVEIMLAEVNRNVAAQTVTRLAGTLAPEFSVTPLNADSPIVLSENYGKVIVVCFWTTDDTMVTGLNAVQRQFKSNSDVVLVPVFLQGSFFLEQQRKRLTEQPGFPIVAGESPYATPLLDVFSGAGGATACFVIGRDGRFATEQVNLQQLSATVEEILKKPLDEKLTQERAATATIRLSSDESDRGISGARLRLRAIDEAGKTVREDKYEINGTPRSIRWTYPVLSMGGWLEVELSGRGIARQKKTVADPSRTESITFDNASPRLITGTVTNVETGEPQPDVELVFRSGAGQAMTVRSDASGRIKLPSYPGSFYAVVAPGAGFAVSGSSMQSVSVGEASDPAPLQIKVAPTTTVKGRVLDSSGQPVPGALVMTQASSYAQADGDGAFELPGVASIGRTQLWASNERQEYGAVFVSDASRDKEVTIRIGQGLGGEAVAETTLSEGQTIPSLNVHSLDGESVAWKSVSDRDRLVVIGALWHPETKALIAKAVTWCEANEKPLQILSLDWSLDQARREAETLGLTARTLYAGPGTLELSEQWSVPFTRSAVLVGNDGSFVSEPLP